MTGLMISPPARIDITCRHGLTLQSVSTGSSFIHGWFCQTCTRFHVLTLPTGFDTCVYRCGHSTLVCWFSHLNYALYAVGFRNRWRIRESNSCVQPFSLDFSRIETFSFPIYGDISLHPASDLHGRLRLPRQLPLYCTVQDSNLRL